MEGNRKMTGCLQTLGGHCIMAHVIQYLFSHGFIRRYYETHILK